MGPCDEATDQCAGPKVIFIKLTVILTQNLKMETRAKAETKQAAVYALRLALKEAVQVTEALVAVDESCWCWLRSSGSYLNINNFKELPRDVAARRTSTWSASYVRPMCLTRAKWLGSDTWLGQKCKNNLEL